MAAPSGGALSSPAPYQKLDNTPGGVPLIVGMKIFRGRKRGRQRTHHYPIDCIIRIGLDDRLLDPIPITSTVHTGTGPVSTILSSSKSSADFAQLKFDPQPNALLARELGIRTTWGIRGGEDPDKLWRTRARGADD